MIIVPNLPEVKVEEKASIITNKMKYTANLMYHIEKHPLIKKDLHYVFIRNLTNDSYRVQIKLPDLPNIFGFNWMYPRLGLGEQTSPASMYNSLTPPITKAPLFWMGPVKQLTLNPDDLKEKIFSNITKVNFGVERFGGLFREYDRKSPKARYEAYQIPFTPYHLRLLNEMMEKKPEGRVNRGFSTVESFSNLNIQEPEKTISSTFGKAIHFRFIKKLDFSYPLGDIWNYEDIDKHKIKIKPTYEDFFVIPHKPDWTNPHSDIADIYAYYPDKDTTFVDDIKKDTKSILKSSAVSSLPISFHYQPDKTTKYSFGKDNKQAIKIGAITSDEKTFYDYNNHKIQKGASTEQFDGDMIPYNFRGVYNWKLPLNINGLLKGYTINLSENIDRPFLNTDEGQVILKTQSKVGGIPKSKKILESFIFDKEQIIDIRKRSVDKNLSLIALRRKSHH